MVETGILTDYRNGIMHLTHPSGHIDRITESDIENWINRQDKEISMKRDEISDYMGMKQSLKNSI